MSVARGSQRGVREVDRKDKRRSIEMGSRGGTRSERPASTTGRESVRSARSLRSAAAASSSAAGPSHAPIPSSSGRSRNSTDRLIAEPSRNNSVSSGSRGSSRAASRDLSLAAYILKVRTVAASCDAALEKQKANFQKVPEEMIELQMKIVGVLRLVEETEGRAGSDEMMKGKVSVDMFKELSRTEKNIEEYSKQPVSVLTGMLSGWLFTGEEEKTPARLKLEQLVETCESLVLVEEIVGKQLQVLNWDVDDAIRPPVEQIILSAEQVKVGMDRARDANADTTCCFCCDSAPIPKQDEALKSPTRKSSAGRKSPAANLKTAAGNSDLSSKYAPSPSPL